MTTKLLAGAAAAAAVGGVAVAAVTYHGPVTVHSSSPASTGALFSSGSGASQDRGRSGRPVGHPSGPATAPSSVSGIPQVTPPRSGLGTLPPVVPNPSLVGLCKAWTKKHHPSPSDNSRAFQQLIAAAGGVENVDAFCAALQSPSSPASPPVEQSHDPKSKAPKPPHKTKTPKPPHKAKSKASKPKP